MSLFWCIWAGINDVENTLWYRCKELCMLSMILCVALSPQQILSEECQIKSWNFVLWQAFQLVSAVQNKLRTKRKKNKLGLSWAKLSRAGVDLSSVITGWGFLTQSFDFWEVRVIQYFISVNLHKLSSADLYVLLYSKFWALIEFRSVWGF